MHTKLFFLVIFASSTAFSSIQFEPKTINTKSEKKVLLGKDIIRVLKKKNSSFKPLEISKFSKGVQNLFKKSRKELPMSVTADFNGDKVQDLAVLGKAGNTYKLLAFTSSKNSYKVHTISSWSAKAFRETFTYKGKIIRYLSLITKKQIKAPANFNKDAFQLETYQGYTELFYFDGKSFKVNKGAVKLQL